MRTTGVHEPAAEETIRTPDQRIRVFVSSTLGELAPERQAVRAAVERLHLAPVMFELGARPHPPRDLYRAYLRQSHVFVGVYHQRYGWVAPGESISGLEDEFRLSQGMPRLLYLKEPADRIEPRLQAMIDEVTEEGTASYRHFTDAAELGDLVETDLAALLSERFMAPPAAAVGRVADAPAAEPDPLPLPLTPTVGRGRDIDDLAGLLGAGTRLLTVTGPGGVGKTRLALEVARAVGGHFADGVVLVPLEDVPTADLVLPALAARLRTPDSGTGPLLDRLVHDLAARQVLLVLDNMEHVRAAGPAVAGLLSRCPGVAVLVTSRQALRLRGEHEYHLAPLPVPERPEDVDAVPSVELFLQRASAVSPGFGLTDANRPAVAEIVRLLDGLPLAIELAAARCRLLSPAALLARLAERMDVLSDGAGDLPPRQQTLRATLDWSHQLLTPPEQALFARLSVFAGGASLDAVEQICGDEVVPDVLDAVSSLLEKSLLMADTAEAPRVGMLHVVRARAAELLAERGETAVLGDRHARWYADLAEPADILRHNDAPRHWDVVEREVDNLLTAARWAVARSDVPLMVDVTRRLWPWLSYSGRVGELRDAVPRPTDALVEPAEPQARAHLRAVAACYAQTQTGDHVGALESAELALRLAPDAPDRDAQLLLAAVRVLRGALRTSLGQTTGIAEDLETAMATARRQDNAWVLGHATLHRGVWRVVNGDLAGARADLEESITVATAMGHDVLVGQAIGHLAVIDLLDGRLEDSRSRVREQVERFRRTRNLEGLATALDTTAALAVHRGQWETAARTAGAAESLREQVGFPARPLTRGLHDTVEAATREHLGARAAAVTADVRQSDPWTVVEQALRELAPDESDAP